LKKGLFRFYLFQILFTVLIALIAALFISSNVKRLMYQQVEENLKETALLQLPHIPSPTHSPERIDPFCKRVAGNRTTRLTVVDTHGLVLGDSEEEIQKMENHGDRPEIIAALEERNSFSLRFSTTLGKHFAYYAEPVYENGDITAVLRTARSIQSIDSQFYSLRISTIILIVSIIITFGITGFLFTRYIGKALSVLEWGAKEISLGRFSTPIYVEGPKEASTVAHEMSAMAKKLESVITEITSQKMELEAIFTSMVEAVILMDTNLRITMLNNAASELLQIHPQTSIGRGLIEVFRNSALYDFAKEVRESTAPLETDISFISDTPREAVSAAANGTARTKRTVFLQVHGTVVRADPEGPVPVSPKMKDAILLVLADITTIKSIENIRRDFVANVSHELKTPITSITGFVETLLNGAIDEKDEALRFLSIIERHAKRLNSIIDDLLSLSKLEQPEERELEFEVSTISSILSSAVQICREKGIKKEIDIIQDCGKQVQAEIIPLLIEQALVNIIDNAIKYSDPRSSITASCREGKEAKTVEISITDQGYGIPEKDLPRIFERFYRVDKARSREMGGTGLGLAIAKHILRINNGEIRAESTLGIGSTFTLILPKRQQ